MTNTKPRLYFLLFLLLATSVVAYLILKPFLSALVLGAVFAIVCQPLYRALLRTYKQQASLAAITTLLFVFIFIFVPLFLISWQVFGEGQQLYASISGNFDNASLVSWANLLGERLKSLSPVFASFSFDLSLYLKNGLDFLLNNFGSIFLNLARLMTELLVFLFAFYYFLRDGAKIKKAIVRISPLTEEDDEIIIKKIILAVNSVLKGSLLLAIIQGALIAVGLFIFGVPSPVLWGSVAAIGTLIPFVGTTLVVVPATLYLYFNGQTLAALGILLWGLVFVGATEHLLRPPLVGRGMSLHPLLVLLSVLGGLSLFGPVGFILGPLVATLLMVLLDICSTFVTKGSA